MRRAGSRVRVVAQLIDAETDRHLWAETYDRELTDIFAIQSDVALQIAAALEAELTQEERTRIRKEPTDDVQAYQLFLLGRHCLTRWTQEGVDQGLKYLEQAIARDPNYALAYATIAFTYTDLGLGVAGAIPSGRGLPRAKAAVVAGARDRQRPRRSARRARATSRYACDYDWAGAEAELKRAIELNPNSGEAYDFYGLMLSALERYDEAIEMQQRAHELDPLAHRDGSSRPRFSGPADTMRPCADVNSVLEVDPHFALAHATLDGPIC